MIVDSKNLSHFMALQRVPSSVEYSHISPSILPFVVHWLLEIGVNKFEFERGYGEKCYQLKVYW